MKLKKLIDTSFDIDISGISQNSQKVKKDFLFIAYKGTNVDGRDYIFEAINKGAKAVIYEDESGEKKEKQEKGVCFIPQKNLAQHVGEIASRFYGNPGASLKIIGITGTNGKTSVSFFCAQLLAACSVKCAIIGTLGYGFYGKLKNIGMTTPDVITLYKILAELKKMGAEVVAMEVSSHALSQNRVDGVPFTVAVFTNLTQDHLDYHKTMENYGEAKRQLFLKKSLIAKIINADDSFGRTLIKTLEGNIIPYSQEKATKEFSIFQGFVLSNVLASFLAVKALGFPENVLKEAITKIKMPPGRMEKIIVQDKPEVVIDYAHTPDALEKILGLLTKEKHDQLIVVFGCGGDRDKLKRPKMAQVCEHYADKIWVTSDNPRTEKPMDIIAGIKRGFSSLENKVCIVENRREAIFAAISQAQKNDIVLIAGKGHEDYQIIGHKKHYFSDKEEALLALNVDIFDNFVTDTRILQKGDVFVALKGANFDGNLFEKEAYQKGAKFVISQKLFHDPEEKLRELATFRRQKLLSTKVIALTGSVGKTTTKNLLFSILSLAGETVATAKNQNNLLGVPLTILQATPKTKYLIVEAGTNKKGEIKKAEAMIAPDIAGITGIYPVHLEAFKTERGIAQEKAVILQRVKTKVLNFSDQFFNYFVKTKPKKADICSFALNDPQAQIFASEITLQDDLKTHFILHLGKEEVAVTLPILGRHNVINAVMAAAFAWTLKIKKEIIQKGLEIAKPEKHRLATEKGLKNITIIDDTYSSNPQALQKALELMSKAKTKKYLIMADMAELGDNAAQFHKEVAQIAKKNKVDKIYALGDLTKYTVQNFSKAAFFASKDELVSAFLKEVPENSVVLVKGSHVFKLWEVVEKLKV